MSQEGPSGRFEAVLVKASRVFVAVMMVTVAVLILHPDPSMSMGKLVGDDAGYYFGIARNILLGHGVTFDRVNPTNGFNPLYQLVLVVLYPVLGSTPSVWACYHLGAMISWAMFAGSVLLFHRGIREVVGAGPICATATASYTGFFAFKQIYGHDYALVLLLMSGYLVYSLRVPWEGRRTIHWGLDGVFLGLLFLARLDSLSFLAAAFLVSGARLLWLRTAPLQLCAHVAGTILVIAPFVAWGQMFFGTWMPVSAKLKTTFPHPNLSEGVALYLGSSLGVSGKLFFAVAFLVGVVVLGVAGRALVQGRRDWLTDPVRGTLLVFSTYVVGRMTYLLLFSTRDMQEVYLAFALPFVLLAGMVLLGRRPGPHRLGAAVVLFLSAVAFQGYGTWKWQKHREHYQDDENQIALAAWVQEHVGEEEVAYGWSNGLLGFLSDRKWVNGDGVVNTYAYRDVLLSRDPRMLEEWLDEHRVRYVISPRPGEHLGTVVHQHRLRDRGNVELTVVQRW